MIVSKVLVLPLLLLVILFANNGFAEDYLLLRVNAYKDMIKSLHHASLEEKLIKINSFFNQFVSEYDAHTWKKEDYWATPLEFTAKGRGDCEDYAIGKYFALKEVGIDKDKLFIMIVKEKTARDHHMVLAYLQHAKSSPLVLDNLSWKILPLEQRIDLKPVYGFNEKNLYLNGKIAPLTDAFIKEHPEISLWFEVVKKVNNGSVHDSMEH
jgi:predicted transglutaminase-like cysteine proteinase